MENYITLLVATLEKLELVTAKEAEKLDKELKNTTIPAAYRDMKALLDDVFDKVKS